VTARSRSRPPTGTDVPAEIFVLRLYVAGTSERSARAIRNAKQICDEHLAGRYELEVIDIFKQTSRARDDQVVAVPTLIKKLPAPLKRFIGDLSDRDVVLVGLDVKRKELDGGHRQP
jgi:circadian clock protein KaiB